MTREEFLGVFLGVIVKRSDSWLPEEAPEEVHLDIMQKRLSEHNFEIGQILRRQADG